MADETLEELADFFDELGDSGLCPEEYDCTLAVSELHSNTVTQLYIVGYEWVSSMVMVGLIPLIVCV